MGQHRVHGDAVEAVQDMKRRDPRRLRTVGSLSLCRKLLEAGLVDSHTFDGRLQMLEYIPRVLDGPPGLWD